MQIQKFEIKKQILDVARNEFIQNGFRNTNMRTIAKKSGVVLSNIYNYFKKNKDEIFKEILLSVIGSLNNIIKEHNRESHIDINIFTSKSYLKEHTLLFVYFLNLPTPKILSFLEKKLLIKLVTSLITASWFAHLY